MAILGMRLLCVTAAVILMLSQTHARNVTHEDIRDAMMSLVHMFRVSEDKLERHEYREKALGEHLKKALVGLDKKQRALEPLKGMISRLDDRVYNVESIFLQKEEKEKVSQKKTNEILEDIQKSLQTLTAIVTQKTKEDSVTTELDNNLSTTDDSLIKRLDATDAKLDAIKKEIDSLKNGFNKETLRSMFLEVASDVNPLERHISEAEKLLNKYELKLNEYGNYSKVQTDFVPLNEISLADEAWHNKMTEVMERQEQDIKRIQQLLTDAESMWKDLPRLADLNRSTNQTLEAISNLQRNVTDIDENSAGKINTKLREMGEDIQQCLTQGNTMSEAAYIDMQRHYESLHKEVQAFSKTEHVMLQTADNVIATKKRIEYGVHQISMEVSELVRMQGNLLNKTINERLNNIEKTIMTNQTEAFKNLTAKIETEMSQVWRQIGIMYQQLTASRTTLDKLTEQTAQYVNGSATAMDNMKQKVGLITKQMGEVDDNLNYLLGRLSLVTQEFSLIKTGLGEALDKAKTSLSKVSPKPEEETGPGPHQY